jgi:hypothetical protein
MEYIISIFFILATEHELYSYTYVWHEIEETGRCSNSDINYIQALMSYIQSKASSINADRFDIVGKAFPFRHIS